MGIEHKKAILVVSFGTSHKEACTKTIEAIENEICEKYPQYLLYRAWTSGMIRRKIMQRDGVHIFGAKEALEQMYQDGIEEVIVQPTYILNGIEHDRMESVVEEVKHRFTRISVSTPLLTAQKDSEKIVEFILKEWNLQEEEALVYMGHGTEHHSNFAYAALNYQLLSKGYSNIVIGTLAGYPALEDVLAAVKRTDAKKVILVPFLIAAGDHVKNDMAGEEEDSWKSIFEKQGYEVQCVLKGLGEYPAIRQIFIEHLEETLEGGAVC